MRQTALYLLMALALLAAPLPVLAQSDDPACAAVLQDAITSIFDRCSGMDGPNACAASGQVAFQPAPPANAPSRTACTARRVFRPPNQPCNQRRRAGPLF